MRHQDDEPMYRTFEEFEREELRRSDSLGSAVDELFDGMFVEELDLSATGGGHRAQADADDEEE